MLRATDDKLMSRLKRGDLDALGELYRRHGAMVKVALGRYAPNLTDDEMCDLLQDVFLKLRRSAPYYREKGRFRAWLFGIAVQNARNWKKTGAVRSALLEAHNSPPPGLSLVVEGSPETTAVQRDLIVKLLSELPETQREVLILHEVDGFSAREIGGILEISEAAVWTRLHRGRHSLLDGLKRLDPGLTLDDLKREATS